MASNSVWVFSSAYIYSPKHKFQCLFSKTTPRSVIQNILFLAMITDLGSSLYSDYVCNVYFGITYISSNPLSGLQSVQTRNLLDIQVTVFNEYFFFLLSLYSINECCWKIGRSSQVNKNYSNIIFASYCKHCASRNMHKIHTESGMCIYTTLEKPISIVGL